MHRVSLKWSVLIRNFILNIYRIYALIGIDRNIWTLKKNILKVNFFSLFHKSEMIAQSSPSFHMLKIYEHKSQLHVVSYSGALKSDLYIFSPFADLKSNSICRWSIGLFAFFFFLHWQWCECASHNGLLPYSASVASVWLL